MHWDEFEEWLRREMGKRREENLLYGRIHQLEAALHDAKQTIRRLQAEKRECCERAQAAAIGKAFPGAELLALKKTLEEAWLELVLAASPKAEWALPWATFYAFMRPRKRALCPFFIL